MKKSGFTMIELIFVIVILGILAAVAIPKLAATRDDAKIAKGSNELSTAIADMGSYYTSKGRFASATDGGLEQMTNVFPGVTTDFNATGGSVGYEDCFTLSSTSSIGAAQADGINLKYTAGGATPVCKSMAVAARKLLGQDTSFVGNADANLTHTFGGTSVTW